MTKRDERRERVKAYMQERRRAQDEAFQPFIDLVQQAAEAFKAGDLARYRRLDRQAQKAYNEVPAHLRETRRDRRARMYEAADSERDEETNDGAS